MDIQLQVLLGTIVLLLVIFLMGQVTVRNSKFDLIVRVVFWLGGVATVLTHIVWGVNRLF
jgi:hypothetical protein